MGRLTGLSSAMDYYSIPSVQKGIQQLRTLDQEFQSSKAIHADALLTAHPCHGLGALALKFILLPVLY